MEKERGQYHHGDLRRALLDAALQLLGEPGAGEVTLREVARRAGVTHAAPYRHFTNKEALLDAVSEEGFRLLTECMREHMKGKRRADARLRASGVGYILFAVEHPAHFRAMFLQLGVSKTMHTELSESGDSAFDVLMDGVRAAQAEGSVRDGNPLPLALSCWSMTHGAAMLLVEAGLGRMVKGLTARAFAEQVTEDVVRGMAPR